MVYSVLALIKETFLEALSKKIFLAYLVIATLILVLIGIFIFTSSSFDVSAFTEIEPELREIAFREAVISIQTGLGGFFYTASVLFALFITANIVPTIMEKGTIDLYLSKPFSREVLLFGKLLGGFVVAGSGLVYFILVSWLLIGASTGVWNAGYLYSLFPAMLTYLAFYSISALFAVLTQSYAIGLIVSYLHIFILSPLLHSRNELLFSIIESPFWQGVINFLFAVLPQVQGMAEVAARIIMDQPIVSSEPIWNMALFSVVLLGLTSFLFRNKEF